MQFFFFGTFLKYKSLFFFPTRFMSFSTTMLSAKTMPKKCCLLQYTTITREFITISQRLLALVAKSQLMLLYRRQASIILTHSHQEVAIILVTFLASINNLTVDNFMSISSQLSKVNYVLTCLHSGQAHKCLCHS